MAKFLIFLAILFSSSAWSAVHIPNPFPEFASTKIYPNLGKDPNSQRRYFKDWAVKFFDLYTREFIAENKLNKNLFERQKFLSEAHAAIDKTPDQALLYLSETFRKVAFTNMLTMAREKYPEVFKYGTVEAQDDLADARARQEGQAKAELAVFKQKVTDLERQINTLKNRNEKLLTQLRQAGANRLAKATPAPGTDSPPVATESQVQEKRSKFSQLMSSVSNTQKIIILLCAGLLLFAVFLRKKS